MGEDVLQWRLVVGFKLLKLKKTNSTLKFDCLLCAKKTMTEKTMEWEARITSNVFFAEGIFSERYPNVLRASSYVPILFEKLCSSWSA